MDGREGSRSAGEAQRGRGLKATVLLQSASQLCPQAAHISAQFSKEGFSVGLEMGSPGL